MFDQRFSPLFLIILSCGEAHAQRAPQRLLAFMNTLKKEIFELLDFLNTLRCANPKLFTPNMMALSTHNAPFRSHRPLTPNSLLLECGFSLISPRYQMGITLESASRRKL